MLLLDQLVTMSFVRRLECTEPSLLGPTAIRPCEHHWRLYAGLAAPNDLKVAAAEDEGKTAHECDVRASSESIQESLPRDASEDSLGASAPHHEQVSEATPMQHRVSDSHVTVSTLGDAEVVSSSADGRASIDDVAGANSTVGVCAFIPLGSPKSEIQPDAEGTREDCACTVTEPESSHTSASGDTGCEVCSRAGDTGGTAFVTPPRLQDKASISMDQESGGRCSIVSSDGLDTALQASSSADHEVHAGVIPSESNVHTHGILEPSKSHSLPDVVGVSVAAAAAAGTGSNDADLGAITTLDYTHGTDSTPAGAKDHSTGNNSPAAQRSISPVEEDIESDVSSCASVEGECEPCTAGTQIHGTGNTDMAPTTGNKDCIVAGPFDGVPNMVDECRAAGVQHLPHASHSTLWFPDAATMWFAFSAES